MYINCKEYYHDAGISYTKVRCPKTHDWKKRKTVTFLNKKNWVYVLRVKLLTSCMEATTMDSIPWRSAVPR
jgi:hypothetical protein